VIVVDTSVWVEALRHGGSDAATTLRALIDADEVALPLPVRIELLNGVASRDRPGLQEALTALPVLRPTEETWWQIESWVELSARKGQRFALTDLLIAALAGEVDGLVWSLDDDFQRMARLKLVRLYG
jgi:predicted nucleic acid-binding protein